MTTERFVLRVWLPDRPGALGAVASRIGAVGGDVTAIEIIDRGEGAAIDELTVRLPSGHLDLALREIAAVDGARVETARPAPAADVDPRLASLDAARVLLGAATGADLCTSLAAEARALVGADWSAVLRPDGESLATEGSPPAGDWVAALARGAAELPSGVVGDANEEEVVSVRLDDIDLLLLVGRGSVPLRQREAHVLAALGSLVQARWVQLEHA